VDLHEEQLDGRVQGVAIGSSRIDEVGVVVLAGSSGRVDVGRARLFAERGALAVALRWFGGPGQSPGICEIPLETFTLAVDWLVDRGVRRAGLVGVSKGAEAALLVACHDARVRSVVAIAPSSVAWGNIGPGLDGQAYPYRSSWTWRNRRLPFVPYDESWAPPAGDGPVAYRSLYEQSLQTATEAAVAAAIPIERAAADVLLIAGQADAMWPSDSFAAALAERRHQAGRQIEVIRHPEAGHRPYFPGEPAPASSTDTAYGGSSAADAALGQTAWQRVLTHLGLR
jgi:dienelactone hydrolase